MNNEPNSLFATFKFLCSGNLREQLRPGAPHHTMRIHLQELRLSDSPCHELAITTAELCSFPQISEGRFPCPCFSHKGLNLINHFPTSSRRILLRNCYKIALSLLYKVSARKQLSWWLQLASFLTIYCKFEYNTKRNNCDNGHAQLPSWQLYVNQLRNTRIHRRALVSQTCGDILTQS
jgi:hypothetical protein